MTKNPDVNRRSFAAGIDPESVADDASRTGRRVIHFPDGIGLERVQAFAPVEKNAGRETDRRRGALLGRRAVYRAAARGGRRAGDAHEIPDEERARSGA